MVFNHPMQRFIDTNILVYSVDLSVDNLDKHRSSLEILRPSEQEILCLSPQILAEFYAVITSSRMVTNPISANEALSRIKRLLQMPNIKLLPMKDDFMFHWVNLLEKHSVIGANVFDLMHIAMMLSYDITSIYTFNVDDFIWCQDIKVIVPQ